MKAVLITGANKGFGRELVSVYMEKGWRTFPLVRSREAASLLISAYPENCHPIIGDVAFESVAESISAVLHRFTDTLDLLINNAGNIKKIRGVSNTSARDLLELFDVHCAGALRCVKAAMPFLQQAENPVIINITSRRGSIANTVNGHDSLIYSYKIAKCAQNMLTVCLHRELKADNIKAFSIHPGRLKTSVAPPDADTEPRDAAEKLYEWIQGINDKLECRCYDLMSGRTIDW
jgi:NAD(P)-dependent dehydrogenase (short-subunit alcohol dehydrogenase family)